MGIESSAARVEEPVASSPTLSCPDSHSGQSTPFCPWCGEQLDTGVVVELRRLLAKYDATRKGHETARENYRRRLNAATDDDDARRIRGRLDGATKSIDRVSRTVEALRVAVGAVQFTQGIVGDGTVSVPVSACSSCGRDHPVEFRPLAEPVDGYTHAGPCPATGAEILFRHDDEEPKA